MGAPPGQMPLPVAGGARLDHIVCLAENRLELRLPYPSDEGPYAGAPTPGDLAFHTDLRASLCITVFLTPLVSRTEPACTHPSLTCRLIQVISIYRRASTYKPTQV